jgi:hypothetical protein
MELVSTYSLHLPQKGASEIASVKDRTAGSIERPHKGQKAAEEIPRSASEAFVRLVVAKAIPSATYSDDAP